MFLTPPRFSPSYNTVGPASRALCRSSTSRAGWASVKSCTSTAPRRSITTSTLAAPGTTRTALDWASPERRADPSRAAQRGRPPGARSLLLARRRRRRGGLHERANRELRFQQRAQRVAHELLGLLLRLPQHHVLRHDDTRQARDVGQELAQLVVMPEDLQAIAVRIERLPRLGVLWID